LIDLHCHLLPGIDDGPVTTEESLMLAREAASDGIDVIAATPHLRADHPRVRPLELAGRCDALKDALAAEGSVLEVVPGAEVAVTWALDAAQEDLRLATYGQRGTDALVETPYGPLTSNFEELLFDRFSARGVRILLAHPERNPTFQQEPERLAELVRRGVLTQITARSLSRSRRRSPVRRLATAMVSEGLAHVLASDSHGVDRRASSLSAGVAAAAGIDAGRARWMVTDAPAAILAGEPLPPLPPAPRRRWLLGRRAF
jgi:protein-tyrosine phosphatase